MILSKATGVLVGRGLLLGKEGSSHLTEICADPKYGLPVDRVVCASVDGKDRAGLQGLRLRCDSRLGSRASSSSAVALPDRAYAVQLSELFPRGF